jgi:hypothetical protein
MDKIRESKRIAQAKWRAKQKELPCVDSTVDSTRYLVDGTEEDKEEEKEIDIDLDIEKEKKPEKTDLRSVVDLFHSICISFPRVRSLSEARKKAIRARLNTYSMDDFRTVFENAEASSFLKGSNDRNWQANFDWLIADKNMAKVLEGNYADKPGRYKEKVPGWSGFTLGEAEIQAIEQIMQDDPETKREREKLAQELQQFGRGVGA